MICTPKHDNIPAEFADIAPYSDREFKEKLTHLVSEPGFEHAVRYVMPDVDYPRFVQEILAVETQHEFQSRIMGNFLAILEKQTTYGISSDGVENVTDGKTFTFITNHRDIVLDASFLNLCLIRAGKPITQVAIGKRPELGVFGSDYDTHDGTGVRDYIHVCDLAAGHVCALKAIQRNCGLGIYNLGTGHGYSVLDVVKAFEKANGVHVPYSIKPRRPGDIATCYCNPAKAEAELGWKAEFGIEEMCRDSWNWQKNNPNGFEE